ncbi:FixJ family two-component response regulator [Rhodoligotrophos appendicifer]|uniref:response regulator transcription factor n=1 Tax=Rhodoligotrophos appendicifer TaxID=987056 RepID=UPI0011849D9B|nr:LuxR C-terminal-related transcriptional regulator [Rhodoligotrophos appendicifer]
MPLVIHSHHVSARPRTTCKETASKARVLVVDNDEDRWASLGRELHRSGTVLDVSAQFPYQLVLKRPETPTCLVIALPHGRFGLQFLKQFNAAETPIPLIFVAESADVATSVEAMKSGAIDFLCQPYRDHDLLEAIETALTQDRARCESHQLFSHLTRLYETLSERERQVMDQVVKGKMNKQVAFVLGISEITVKAHRGKVMRKMKARSLPDLTRMADAIAQVSPIYDHQNLGALLSRGDQTAR